MIIVQWTHVKWSSLKVAKDRDGFALYWRADGGQYWVWGTNRAHYFEAFVKATADVAQFEATYKLADNAVPSKEDVLALSAAPVNSMGAALIEMTPRLTQKKALTIISHDFSEPTTWYQNSAQVLSEELVNEGAGTFGSTHAFWINVEHPKLFADETLDGVAWATAGYPAAMDPYYRSWIMPDASLRFRNHYYPIVQVQAGGAGQWNTVAADHTASGINPVYGHTFNYTAGKVHFNDVLNWPIGTKVRASYFYAEETELGCRFEIGPPAGKKWLLTLTEVQISSGASWQDTIRFYGVQQGVPGQRARYKTYGNMQSTSTSSQGFVVAEGGNAESPQPWPAEAENGWMNGGCAGLRNATRKLPIPPWDYRRPFELLSSLGNKVAVTLAKGKKLLTTDQANVTLYCDEFDE